MAMLEDSIEEFKKLPTVGKVGIGAAILLVVGVALYERNKAASVSTSPLSGMSSSSMDTTGTAGTQSPFSSIMSGSNSVPLLPSGTNPVYDGQGNLVAFQPAPTPATPTPVAPPPITPPSHNPTQPPPQPTINTNPLVPNSLKVWLGRGGVLYQGTDVNHQSVVNLPKNSGVRAGSDGRYWAITPSGQQLITNNFQAIPPGQKAPY